MRLNLYRWRAISNSSNPEELNDLLLLGRIQYLFFIAGLAALLIAATALWGDFRILRRAPGPPVPAGKLHSDYRHTVRRYPSALGMSSYQDFPSCYAAWDRKQRI